MLVTNSSCCSDPRFLCAKCSSATPKHSIVYNESFDNPPKPEPMGLPVWNFEPAEQQPAKAAMTTNVPRDDRPEPMGLPVWTF